MSRERSATLFPLPPLLQQPLSCAGSSLHVDGVRVLLAQGFVFLGVERLPLQIHMADLGQKTDRVTQATCKPRGGERPKRFVTHLGKVVPRADAGGSSPFSHLKVLTTEADSLG